MLFFLNGQLDSIFVKGGTVYAQSSTKSRMAADSQSNAYRDPGMGVIGACWLAPPFQH